MSALRQTAASRDSDTGEPDQLTGQRLLASLACAAFVLLAVALEVVSGQAANTLGGGSVEGLVPLGWPTPLRVGWWLLVAGAAAGHRVLLHGSRGARPRVMVALAAAPFVVFAAGVAVGAEWATWH